MLDWLFCCRWSGVELHAIWVALACGSFPLACQARSAAAESHTLRTSSKPPDALHTEAVVAALRLARRAILLTGTPSLSCPFDLFRQVGNASRISMSLQTQMSVCTSNLLGGLHHSWLHLPRACGRSRSVPQSVAVLQVDAILPGLLGRSRIEFATAYCNRREVPLPGGCACRALERPGPSLQNLEHPRCTSSSCPCS